MHDELFKKPAVATRYSAGPYLGDRERFLREAHAHGYSRSTLERMAWVLLLVAEAVRDHDGKITAAQLESLVTKRIRLRSGRSPSEHTIELLERFGEAWLTSIGALTPASEPPACFERELSAFIDYMRVERGLSEVTIATRCERMRWFFASLPARLRSLDEITIQHIDAFLAAKARHRWSRSSLHALGSSVRSFFCYAGQRGWCRSDLALAIDLPRLYALEDVPRAPATQDVDRLLEATASSHAPVAIRDHAILSLLVHYGFRRGEVERLTLDDLDWVTETVRILRPKQRRPQTYPLSVPVGQAILRYLREVRPRCGTRAVFLTIKAPFRPLSAASITAMVHMRLTQQGIALGRMGAHSLRHACASQLMEAGFTLKQIADHLGQRSLSSTRIYTKIDLNGLRQVAELDLGALL
jgi:site-specific recombinase XerD